MSDAWSQAAAPSSVAQVAPAAPAQPMPAATAHRTAPRTAFNFAATEWEAKKREQKFGLVVLLVLLLVFGWVGNKGRTAGSSSAAKEREIASLRLRETQANAEIAELTGGIEDLPGLVATKQRGVDYVFSNDVDVVEVMKIISTIVLPEITIKTVRVLPREEGTESVGTSLFVLELNAEGSSLETPARWQNKVSELAGTKLENPVVSYEIAGETVTMRFSAGLIDDIVMTRRNDSRNQVGVPPSTTAPATTAPVTTAPGDANG